MIKMVKRLGYCLLPSLMLVILGAHYFRAGEYGFVFALIGTLFFFFYQKDWQTYAVSFFLFYGSAEWILATGKLIQIRTIFGQEYIRAAIILLCVSLLTLISAIWVYKKTESNIAINKNISKTIIKTKAWIFCLVFIGLYWIDKLLPSSFLIAERFIPFMGTVQSFAIACYAVWVFAKLENPKTHNTYRPIIWICFSLFFFTQLFLGLFGIQKFLMTGQLHFPVPGFIVFGAVYKGTAGFMFALVLTAVLLTGSGWCSHLCYFGAFDAWASRKKTVKQLSPKITLWLPYLRFAVLFAGIAIAFGLSYNNVPLLWVLTVSWTYILSTIIIITLLSRKWQLMIHCSAFCPMGAVISCLAKISPWRIKILPQCNNCNSCEKVCKYKAISEKSRTAGKVLHNCTLCLDCMNICKQKAIYLKIFGIKASKEQTRIVFIAMITIIHALFLAFAKV